MDLLRHLRFFVAVAEHRHFGHAALSLAMTQPPLSQGVQRLERHLNQRLFARDARHVALTPAGAALLPLARDLLHQADTFVDTALTWTDATVVRVGLAADLDGDAGRVLAQLTSSEALFSPLFAGSRELLSAMREGKLDIAVVRHPSPVDGLLAGEVLTTEAAIDTEALDRGSPVVLPPRHHHPAAHDQVVDSLHRLGFDNPVQEISLHQERQAWIAAGMGTGVSGGPEGRTGRAGAAFIPLRFRVVVPILSEQRASVDHLQLMELIEAAWA